MGRNRSKARPPKLLPKPDGAEVFVPSLCEACKQKYCIIELDEDLVLPCINLKEVK